MGDVLREVTENFQKFAKTSGKSKNVFFYHIIQKSLKTMRSIFACLDDKQMAGKILKFFEENSVEK